MKSVIAFWTVVVTALGGLLFWRNKRRYSRKPMTWVLGKSAIELVVLFLTATFLPALLIVWLVTWASRPIKTPWLRTTIAVIAGITFGFLSNVALEVLIFLGVFSIDMKTGAHDRTGFLNAWRRAKISEARHQDHSVAAAA